MHLFKLRLRECFQMRVESKFVRTTPLCSCSSSSLLPQERFHLSAQRKVVWESTEHSKQSSFCDRRSLSMYEDSVTSSLPDVKSETAERRVFRLHVRGPKPKNVRTEKHPCRQTWSLLKTVHCFKSFPDVPYFTLLHFLAEVCHSFRQSWGFLLVPVSQATTQIHLP